MKKLLIVFFGVAFLGSCTTEKQTGITQITGEIKGLKQGTLYIQQLKDSTLVTLDSIVLKGVSTFNSSFNLEEPEVLYLGLNRGTSNSLDNLILFFAEPGNIKITSFLDNFSGGAKVEGSTNHDLYSKYLESKLVFTHKTTDLVKNIILAQKNNQTKKADSLEIVLNRNAKMQYFNAVNFVSKNNAKEVAPYVTLTDIVPISSNRLDSIYAKFTPEVANSKYGKILNNYITLIKQQE